MSCWNLTPPSVVSLSHPYINVTKLYGFDSWKRNFKDGKIESILDSKLRTTVYRISGSDVANNFIQLPKFNHHQLKLLGRFFYLNFQVDTNNNFTFHLDLKLSRNQTIRLSVSSLFKDFSVTSSCIKLPYVFNNRHRNADGLFGDDDKWIKCESDDRNWTILCLDLEVVVNKLMKKKHLYIKCIKLCSNITISNLFSSDHLFVPEYYLRNVISPLCYSLPKEMSFPLQGDGKWEEVYNFISFPQNICSESCKNCRQVDDDVEDELISKDSDSLPLEMQTNHEKSAQEQGISTIDKTLKGESILRLKHVLGFGGGTTKYALMDRSAGRVIYPCHAVVVLQDVISGTQQFMIGHTDKISCLSTDRDFRYLASGQEGDQAIVRIWNVETLECLAIFKTHNHSLFSLSMSKLGNTLCGVGKSGHFKNMMVVWDTSEVIRGGKVKVICKGHSEVTIRKMLMFNNCEDRMISCGRGNIRLWRVRRSSLVTTCINIHGMHNEEFVDLCFENEAIHSNFTVETTNRRHELAYIATRSGLALVVDCKKMNLLHTISFKDTSHYLPESLNVKTILITQNYICLGYSDGILRLWMRDASEVLLNTKIDDLSIDCLSASNDCVSILVGTGTGNLKLLDLKTRNVRLLQASCGGKIINCSIDGRSKHLVTIANDGTIKTWHFSNMQEIAIMKPSSNDMPTISAVHPKLDIVACGYQSGVVKIFNNLNFQLVFKYSWHCSPITGLAFDIAGSRLYSCSSCGLLIMHKININYANHNAGGTGRYDDDGKVKANRFHHIELNKLLETRDNERSYYNKSLTDVIDYHTKGDDSQEIKINFTQIRIICNAVLEETTGRNDVFAFSPDGRLMAYVGPSPHSISIVDSLSLSEVKRADLSELRVTSGDALKCVQVKFDANSSTCLILLLQGGSFVTYNFERGLIINELNTGKVYSDITMEIIHGTQFLATSNDKIIKIWLDKTGSNFQIFIGHSAIIHQIVYSPLTSHLISCSDTLFIWEFLGEEKNIDKLRDDKTDCNSINKSSDSNYDSVFPRWEKCFPGLQEMPRLRVPEPITYSDQLDRLDLRGCDGLENTCDLDSYNCIEPERVITRITNHKLAEDKEGFCNFSKTENNNQNSLLMESSKFKRHFANKINSSKR